MSLPTRELPLASRRLTQNQSLRDHKSKDRVAQKLKLLVILVLLARRGASFEPRAMSERPFQQLAIPEPIADSGLQQSSVGFHREAPGVPIFRPSPFALSLSQPGRTA